MMEAAITSEALVNFYQTARRNIPEDFHLHTRRRENLKSRPINRWVINFIAQVLSFLEYGNSFALRTVNNSA
jgi:hypothetical protein